MRRRSHRRPRRHACVQRGRAAPAGLVPAHAAAADFVHLELRPSEQGGALDALASLCLASLESLPGVRCCSLLPPLRSASIRFLGTLCSRTRDSVVGLAPRAVKRQRTVSMVHAAVEPPPIKEV